MNSSVVDKLREILLNLRIPRNYSMEFPRLSTSHPLHPAHSESLSDDTPSGFHNPRSDTDVVYGHPNLFYNSSRSHAVRESSTASVFGVEIAMDTDRKGGNNRELLVGSGVVGDPDSLLKHLQELIQVLKKTSTAGTSSKTSSMPGSRVSSGGGFVGKEMELNLTLEDITDLNNLMGGYGTSSVPLKHVFIILSYLLIAFVSIVGNLLVVQLVIRSRRLHTLTHALLANLAVADLFMSTLNIPFSAARVILAEWPFGSFLCQAVPFVQVTSVYVTSITMAVIALDRYQVIMNPLGRRMKNSQGILLVIAIWSLSGLLSLPYALHHKVVTVLTVRVVNRCQAEFPSMVRRRWLTVATVLGQYFIPLGFTTASYVSIMIRLGLRSSAMGSTTPRQVAAQSRAKRKTIKMLVLTVIFFAVCWAPINAYHLLTHFSLVPHNSTAILICHLVAMSSTCYNPFIYCWLNEHFRREAMKWLCCCCLCRKSSSPHHSPILPGVDANGTSKQIDGEDFRRTPSSHHSGNSIPLFNLRSGCPRSGSINLERHHHRNQQQQQQLQFHQQQQQQHQQEPEKLRRENSSGSHRGIVLDLSSSSPSSSYAVRKLKYHGALGRAGKRGQSEHVVVSSGDEEWEDSNTNGVSNKARREISHGIGLDDYSWSSFDNCNDSGRGTTKAESPV